MECSGPGNKNSFIKETIIPDDEILMAIKTEPEVIIEHEEEPGQLDQIKKDIAVVNAKLELILKRQDEITNLIAENNVLLRRNIGLCDTVETIFPLDSKNGLKKLEMDLNTDKRVDIIALMKRILSGGVKNVDRIFSKNIICTYNLDGVKGKKPLKKYKNVLNAIYDSTKREGRNYKEFVKELRVCLHRFKNTINRANSRKEKVLKDRNDTTTFDKKIDQLRVVMEQKLNHIQAKINVLLEVQEEQNLLLRNFIASQQDMNSKFPLRTVKNLKELNREITLENRETYKNTIKTLFKPQGIRKNLKYLLSTEIINEYNIDGVHGKKCLRDLRNFYEVVIDSIEITSKSGTAEQQLRDAIRLAKKRYLKHKSVSRKNTLSNK